MSRRVACSLHALRNRCGKVLGESKEEGEPQPLFQREREVPPGRAATVRSEETSLWTGGYCCQGSWSIRLVQEGAGKNTARVSARQDHARGT